MLKILVVDDEDIEREGILFLLKKFQYNLEIIEAKNGKEAYFYLQENHVDILFTDIKMPFIDGLELTKLAINLYSDLKVIIFSGFHEFEYAKKALTLGVIDYILKPIDVNEFKKVIDSTLEKINYQKKQLESRNQNDLFIRRYILFCYINGTSLKLLSQEYNSTYNLDFLNGYSKIFMLEFGTGFFENAGLLFEKEVLPFLNFKHDYLNLNNSQSLIFIKKSNNYSNINYRETAELLLDIIKEKYSTNCYISLSNSIKSSDDIPIEISSLENLANNKFFLSDTYIFSNDEIYESQLNDPEFDYRLISEIQKDIENKNIISLRQSLELFYKKYHNKNKISQIYIKFILSSLIKDIYKALPESEFNEESTIIEKVYRLNTFNDIWNEILSLVDRFDTQLHQNTASGSNAVELAKQYIAIHYGKDLNLDILASHVYLTPRYLSYVFIQETGCGINKYIKAIRMQKAKELLENTNMKIASICEKVGYNNVSYFCQSFREFYGKSPEKYRKKD
ncbi:MAG: response regulator [Clostridium beijerinckii]|jgi:two-component system response regulator YesN|nr:response regulator [Clostridium beijerinckii]MCI1578263.1 response regulator [Clostridium beijerinckii]MCI1583813.1 response regulator [Clostridium beijerinckii]MCI1621462.1 response regulator [Clostridium beijerinckii]